MSKPWPTNKYKFAQQDVQKQLPNLSRPDPAPKFVRVFATRANSAIYNSQVNKRSVEACPGLARAHLWASRRPGIEIGCGIPKA